MTTPDTSSLVERLRSLAGCDARAGAPLGRCMEKAADHIEALERQIAEERAERDRLAAEVERLREVLSELVNAIEAGGIRISSWDVQDPGGDPEAFWQWHEEWLHNAAKPALSPPAEQKETGR